jgi:hypothetical protein
MQFEITQYVPIIFIKESRRNTRLLVYREAVHCEFELLKCGLYTY